MLSLGYPWLVGRFMGVPLARQLQRAARPALATATLFGGAVVASGVAGVENWWALICPAALTLVGAAVAASYAGLSASQRRRLRGRLETMALARRH